MEGAEWAGYGVKCRTWVPWNEGGFHDARGMWVPRDVGSMGRGSVPRDVGPKGRVGSMEHVGSMGRGFHGTYNSAP